MKKLGGLSLLNAGHALLPEQPEAVAKAVLDFLAKHHPTETNKQENKTGFHNRNCK